MHELDLVPQAYRHWLWLRRQLVTFTALLLAVMVCLAAARMFLGERLAQAAGELHQRQADEQTLVGDRARLDALRERERQLLHREQSLQTLREGLLPIRMFEAVDAALDGRVWFREWSYEHSRETTEAARAATPVADWRVVNRMQIGGQATDHGALAAFVRRLAAQPLVADVRLLDTQIRRYTETTVVDFSLAVWLADAGRP